EQVRRMDEFQPPQPGPFDELLKHPWIQSFNRQAEEMLHNALEAIRQALIKISPSAAVYMPENILHLFSGFVGFLLILLALYVFYLILTTMVRLADRTRPAPATRRERIVAETLLVDSGHHYRQARLLADQ